MCHCIVWYCPSCWGGIVLNRVSLHCLVLSFMLGGIVLNRVTALSGIVLHVGGYCIESCVTALSGTAAAGWLGSAYIF